MIYKNIKVDVTKVPVRFLPTAHSGLKMQLTRNKKELHTLEDFYKDAEDPKIFYVITGEMANKSLLEIALKYAVNKIDTLDLNIPDKYKNILEENNFIIS